jgi:hypothetical protein
MLALKDGLDFKIEVKKKQMFFEDIKNLFKSTYVTIKIL